ncbi:hypothetical protein DLAC_01553 [Tieghemostelium lacteum]|uniref:Uncharacterized protein n=1 Tax=Tieghemostelium lacteum TaxID=361077 RepID=A0A152A5P6_TIELA|nr:hypothetical protein DLAC_01553 [Tieghemostelium lacteum]|eukprot:KYR01559.1 hypothetical protein DLAC_01553 [Tieghemostelium lacteum]
MKNDLRLSKLLLKKIFQLCLDSYFQRHLLAEHSVSFLDTISFYRYYFSTFWSISKDCQSIVKGLQYDTLELKHTYSKKGLLYILYLLEKGLRFKRVILSMSREVSDTIIKENFEESIKIWELINNNNIDVGNKNRLVLDRFNCKLEVLQQLLGGPFHINNNGSALVFQYDPSTKTLESFIKKMKQYNVILRNTGHRLESLYIQTPRYTDFSLSEIYDVIDKYKLSKLVISVETEGTTQVPLCSGLMCPPTRLKTLKLDVISNLDYLLDLFDYQCILKMNPLLQTLSIDMDNGNCVNESGLIIPTLFIPELIQHKNLKKVVLKNEKGENIEDLCNYINTNSIVTSLSFTPSHHEGVKDYKHLRITNSTLTELNIDDHPDRYYELDIITMWKSGLVSSLQYLSSPNCFDSDGNQILTSDQQHQQLYQSIMSSHHNLTDVRYIVRDDSDVRYLCDIIRILPKLQYLCISPESPVANIDYFTLTLAITKFSSTLKHLDIESRQESFYNMIYQMNHPSLVSVSFIYSEGLPEQHLNNLLLNTSIEHLHLVLHSPFEPGYISFFKILTRKPNLKSIRYYARSKDTAASQQAFIEYYSTPQLNLILPDKIDYVCEFDLWQIYKQSISNNK